MIGTKKLGKTALIAAAGLVTAAAIMIFTKPDETPPAATAQASAESGEPTSSPSALPSAPAAETPSPISVKEALAAKYADLGLIDVHNHDAPRYADSLRTWDRYHVGKVVLFGDISEPSAMLTDAMSWEAYRSYPDRIYPFFSGFDMFKKEGLQTVRDQLEKGYLGIGETVAASTLSPVLQNVIWKAEDPMDGNLPDVYALCAEYNVPILLHIDPPNGTPVEKLKEALDRYPDTKIIFAHANAYQGAVAIDDLLEEHSNLYIDFFAGFTSYSISSPYRTEAYIDVIERYPDRFFLSTDGAFDMTYDEAIPAMYETLEMLKPETRKKVASGNFQKIIDAEKPTKTQLQRYKELGGTEQDVAKLTALSRHEMNKLLFKLGYT
ncbi:amidohydrolase family protein [Cohnella faecalis]|uniref:Amidohydrolase-related domain-containing protein n=1 Tax=Cohnella faecalis TaxID=2315694 RepID=A0A398CVF0_9BACL|nr:amidohydrolase family protein [Cohnella faecalis]RIE05279.1 hypothetical protein D3H35_01810 [Cohnella faecalis]